MYIHDGLKHIQCHTFSGNLCRVGIPPFMCARKVLEPLCDGGGEPDGGKEDVLWFCHKLPQEVVNLYQK